MNIENVKQELLEVMHSIDKDKLSLADLKLYAEILKTVSEIQAKSYFECMAETIGGFGLGGVKPATLSEMK